ncbi:MAG: DMP19 family protein [Bacteroidaceae bacterium]|nr:DMP19 family protein [Bacteroidaceae bacterium]MBR6893994.1 DMP19 family protein [Bacteroidaceae bacterium]
MTYEDSVTYLNSETDQLIARIDGQLTDDNMNLLSLNEHCLLAYRYLRDEVMDGGFIQLIQNGYGPYVLLGPFPMLMKKEWGQKQFGQFLFDVAREYKAHRSELEADKSDDDFMAQYEQFEALNDYGDDYLDEYEETVTPAIVEHYQSLTDK